jgi:ribose transport system permease protein
LTLYIKYIPSGRKLLLIGGNEIAARLMGIKVNKIKMIAFILCGTLAAFAGMLLTARSTAANRYLGISTHMNVIIACIIGGASLSGGQGTMVGAVFGTVFMALLINSFNLFEISSQWQNITTGIVLLAVVVSDGYASIRKQKALGAL